MAPEELRGDASSQTWSPDLRQGGIVRPDGGSLLQRETPQQRIMEESATCSESDRIAVDSREVQRFVHQHWSAEGHRAAFHCEFKQAGTQFKMDIAPRSAR